MTSIEDLRHSDIEFDTVGDKEAFIEIERRFVQRISGTLWESHLNVSEPIASFGLKILYNLKRLYPDDKIELVISKADAMTAFPDRPKFRDVEFIALNRQVDGNVCIRTHPVKSGLDHSISIVPSDVEDMYFQQGVSSTLILMGH
jgi:deoxyribodipyrimidine photolyase